MNTLWGHGDQTKRRRRRRRKAKPIKTNPAPTLERLCMEAAQAQRVVVDEAEQKIGVPSEEMMTDNDDFRTEK